MPGWLILIVAGICLWGGMIFLLFAAVGVARSEQRLQALKMKEKRARQRRLQLTTAIEAQVLNFGGDKPELGRPAA